MKIGSYIVNSYDELRNKVSWPTWEQLQNSAVVVAIASLIIALIVLVTIGILVDPPTKRV